MSVTKVVRSRRARNGKKSTTVTTTQRVPRRRRASRRTSGFRVNEGTPTRVTLPSMSGVVRTGGVQFTYGPAPYHENHGSGLRVGVRNQAICSVGASNLAAENRIFLFDNAGTPLYCTACTSKLTYKTDAPYLMSLFSDSTVDGIPYLQSIIKLHSQYVIRSLRIRYDPAITTGSSGSLAFAAVKQQYELTSEEASFKSIRSLQTSATTPLWQPVSFDVVRDRDMSKPAVYLYDSMNNLAYGSSPVQLRILGAINSLPSGPTLYGYLTIEEIVVDLYGQRSALQATTGSQDDSKLSNQGTKFLDYKGQIVDGPKESKDSKESKDMKDSRSAETESLERVPLTRQGWVRISNSSSPPTSSSSLSTTSSVSSTSSSLKSGYFQ